VAGSALPRNVANAAERETWIRGQFANTPKPDQLAGLVASGSTGKDPYPFQNEVAASKSPVTFVRAGCGSGKTLAAYLWAAKQHPSKRLYFCYPTTGTATEGYRDYLHNADAELAPRLFHGGPKSISRCSPARATRNALTPTPRPASNRSTPGERRSSVARSIRSSASCRNNRRGLYAWPALAGAAFVFDECHAFDDRLFGAMLRFLRELPGVPALLMTASLPDARLKAIQGVMKRRGDELAELPVEPLECEGWPRYHRRGAIDTRDPWPEIRDELDHGGKVLWVSNTVNRVIASADKADAEGHKQRLIYHSRFRYEDA